MPALKFKIISFFHYLGWLASRLIGRVFFDIRYIDKGNLAELRGAGVIFVANHQSRLDPFLIGSGIPRSYFRSIKCFRYPTYYKYIRWNPFFPLLLWFGAYSVQPRGGNLEKALAKTVKILRDDQSILFFPAGQREKYFNAYDARPGIGFLSKTLDVPLVPVFIKNAFHITTKDLLFRTRKVTVTYGPPFHWRDVAAPEDDAKEISRKIMSRVGALVRFPPSDKEKTFADISGREKSLQTPEALALFASFPADIKNKCVGCYLHPRQHGQAFREIRDYLLAHSEMARYIRTFPGSAEAFEYLYREKGTASAFDNYFLQCKSGQQIYRRLLSLDKNLPAWIKKIYDNKILLVDNIFSGPGRDMIRVLERNSDLRTRVHIRNIDIDQNAIAIGRKVVREKGLEESFSFVCRPYHKVKPRQADLILLIGVLCPLKLHVSERILVKMREYSRPGGGYIIYSTAQDALLQDDPLTDFFMRLVGWRMDYKSDQEAWDLATEAGWEPVEQFFDEPLHHHCMTVARLK